MKMSSKLILSASLMLVVFAFVICQPRSEPQPAADVPVLAELFTSEGCSSCPPADDILREFSEKSPVAGVKVIPIAWHVDYWNDGKWKDALSSADYTRRQEMYGRLFAQNTIYTPELVVAGRKGLIGSRRAEAIAAIAAAAKEIPQFKIGLRSLSSSAPGTRKFPLNIVVTPLAEILPKGSADVMVVLTESGIAREIGGGENEGRKLIHAPSARDARKIASIEIPMQKPVQCNTTLTLLPEWDSAHVSAVVFLQSPADGRILAAAEMPPPPAPGK